MCETHDLMTLTKVIRSALLEWIFLLWGVWGLQGSEHFLPVLTCSWWWEHRFRSGSGFLPTSPVLPVLPVSPVLPVLFG